MLISNPAIAQYMNSQLIEAAQNGRAEEVQALLEGGADVNAKDDDGQTALTVATQAGHTEIAEMLKKAGAKE
jgi:ankyrin repeat protein